MSAERKATGIGALLVAQAAATTGFLLVVYGQPGWALAVGAGCMAVGFASAVVAAARAW